MRKSTHSKYIWRSHKQAERTVFAIDVSDSMGSLSLPREVIEEMVASLEDGSEIGVVTFNHTAEVLVPLTVLNRTTRRELRNQLRGLRTSGGTCLSSGISGALDLLTGSGTIVCLSDGGDRCGARFFLSSLWSQPTYLGDNPSTQELIKRAAQQGVTIQCVGIGQYADTSLLSQLAGDTGGECLVVPDLQSLVHQADLVSKLVRSHKQAERTVFAIDVSDSMGSLSLPREVIEEMVASLEDGSEIGVVTFNHTAEVLVPLTVLNRTTRRELRNQLRGLRTSGGTCLSSGISGALDLLTGSGTIVCLSDGGDRCGARFFLSSLWSQPTYLGDNPSTQELIKRAAQQGVTIQCVGIGQYADTSLLSQLAGDTGGECLVVPDLQSLVHQADLVSKLVRSHKQAERTVFAIDVSDSMGSLSLPREVIEEMVASLEDGSEIGVVTFNHTAEVLVPLTVLNRTTRRELRNQLRGLRTSGGTCLSSGISGALDLLTGSGTIVCLSDGGDRCGARFFLSSLWSQPTYLGDNPSTQELIKRAAQQGVTIQCVGIGQYADTRGIGRQTGGILGYLNNSFTDGWTVHGKVVLWNSIETSRELWDGAVVANSLYFLSRVSDVDISPDRIVVGVAANLSSYLAISNGGSDRSLTLREENPNWNRRIETRWIGGALLQDRNEVIASDLNPNRICDVTVFVKGRGSQVSPLGVGNTTADHADQSKRRNFLNTGLRIAKSPLRIPQDTDLLGWKSNTSRGRMIVDVVRCELILNDVDCFGTSSDPGKRDYRCDTKCWAHNVDDLSRGCQDIRIHFSFLENIHYRPQEVEWDNHDEEGTFWCGELEYTLRMKSSRIAAFYEGSKSLPSISGGTEWPNSMLKTNGITHARTQFQTVGREFKNKGSRNKANAAYLFLCA